jgi:hypothetical protein
MSDFTSLVNRGIRRYVDKYLRRRDFGRCDDCDARALLIRFLWKDGSMSTEMALCNGCYDKLVKEAIE